VIALLGLFASQRVAVLQQQSEFGLRRALGASDRALLQAVLRPALGIAAVGCLLGLALQLAVQQLGALWLQGLPLPQPLQLLAIALLLLGLSVIVALGPARSALRVPAMQVLRAQ
jgi:putative ABC transport system permease protein